MFVWMKGSEADGYVASITLDGLLVFGLRGEKQSLRSASQTTWGVSEASAVWRRSFFV